MKLARNGALLAGLAALGLWLGGLFDGFGGGSGGDGAVSMLPRDSASSTVEQPEDTSVTVTDVPPDKVVDTEFDPTEEALRQNTRVVELTVDVREFSLQYTSNGESLLQPVPLEQIVALIRNAPGDEEGVKVRVRVPPTAYTSAESQLREALQAANIPEDAQRWTY